MVEISPAVTALMPVVIGTAAPSGGCTFLFASRDLFESVPSPSVPPTAEPRRHGEPGPGSTFLPSERQDPQRKMPMQDLFAKPQQR